MEWVVDTGQENSVATMSQSPAESMALIMPSTRSGVSMGHSGDRIPSLMVETTSPPAR